ncbi:MAG: threonine--tRNA ligase, partial [Ruminococcus sp.]|nr:threonine--tRNA ligase [Ruminococcus sp.]
AGIRCSIDDRAEKVGKKIREARLEKLPVWVTVGDRETETETVSVTSRREGDIGSMTQPELLSKLIDDIASKVR